MQAALTLKVTYRVEEVDRERALRVFLCHASSDKEEVRSLCRRLRADGADAWLDEEKLLPGQEWRREIRNAVRRSDAVLVCLSKNSVTREGFVQAELKYALDVAAEKPEGTIYIIPLLLEQCEVPNGLQHMHWVSKIDPGWYLQLSKALALRASLVRTA
jgi:TIR domain-containing protein